MRQRVTECAAEVLCLAGMLAMLLSSCKSGHREEGTHWELSGMRDLTVGPMAAHYEVLPEDKPLPDVGAWLSWQGYDPHEPHEERARYLVSGEQMGHGVAGFIAAIRALEQLPEGSRVLIYPHYRTDLRTCQFIRTYPFGRYWDKLDEVVARRDLKVVFSSRPPAAPLPTGLPVGR